MCSGFVNKTLHGTHATVAGGFHKESRKAFRVLILPIAIQMVSGWSLMLRANNELEKDHLELRNRRRSTETPANTAE